MNYSGCDETLFPVGKTKLIPWPWLSGERRSQSVTFIPGVGAGKKKKNPPTAFQLMRFQLSFLADVMTTTNNISLMDIQRN